MRHTRTERPPSGREAEGGCEEHILVPSSMCPLPIQWGGGEGEFCALRAATPRLEGGAHRRRNPSLSVHLSPRISPSAPPSPAGRGHTHIRERARYHAMLREVSKETHAPVVSPARAVLVRFPLPSLRCARAVLPPLWLAARRGWSNVCEARLDTQTDVRAAAVVAVGGAGTRKWWRHVPHPSRMFVCGRRWM